MKKTSFIILALAIGVCLWGCSKKEPSEESAQEPMSMESMSTVNVTTPAQAPEVKVTEVKAPAAVVEAPKAEVTATAKGIPTPIEIQTALKNAGLYTGEIDGKIGPKTKRAIEAFQKENGLKADGKVGSKTWEALSKNLNVPDATPSAAKKNKKR